MSFFDTVKEVFSNKSEKRKEEQELINRIRLETEIQRKQILEEELRKNMRELAIGKAKKDAAELSGLQKHRAENRLRNLNNPKTQMGFFGKLAEYTQRNIARREENLKRTEETRGKSKQILRSHSRKPFTPTGFGHG